MGERFGGDFGAFCLLGKADAVHFEAKLYLVQPAISCSRHADCPVENVCSRVLGRWFSKLSLFKSISIILDPVEDLPSRPSESGHGGTGFCYHCPTDVLLSIVELMTITFSDWGL